MHLKPSLKRLAEVQASTSGWPKSRHVLANDSAAIIEVISGDIGENTRPVLFDNATY